MWPGPNGAGSAAPTSSRPSRTASAASVPTTSTSNQTHWPDYETPLDETLTALDSLVQSGKVRYIGCSNYPAWLLLKSLWASDARRLTRFDCVQPHYSLLHRSEFERELADACRDQQVGVIPYSPLAAGFLTGKFTRENHAPDSTRSEGSLIQRLLRDERAFRRLDLLREIAAAHETHPAPNRARLAAGAAGHHRAHHRRAPPGPAAGCRRRDGNRPRPKRKSPA